MMQGGWKPEKMDFVREINAQIDQAVANVDLALRMRAGRAGRRFSG